MQIFEQQNAVKNAFFDYSLWNHYVKDPLPLFLSHRRGYIHLIFLSYFLLCTFCTIKNLHGKVDNLDKLPR